MRLKLFNSNFNSKTKMHLKMEFDYGVGRAIDHSLWFYAIMIISINMNN